MPQCVFEIKTTGRGFYVCIAYLAVRNGPGTKRPVAVSKFMYVNPVSAPNDVLNQLRNSDLSFRVSSIASAAAGGAR